VNVDELLERARSRLDRVEPAAIARELEDGAVLIDIRCELQRERDGVVPGALLHPRNVLEWRCDPACEHRDPRVGGTDRRVILMCDGGYQSSLAAASLQELGFERAADLVGGFQAWRAAGLPVEQVSDRSR
jgi:rhodanese-related sulfurtransferase